MIAMGLFFIILVEYQSVEPAPTSVRGSYTADHAPSTTNEVVVNQDAHDKLKHLQPRAPRRGETPSQELVEEAEDPHKTDKLHNPKHLGDIQQSALLVAPLIVCRCLCDDAGP